MSLVIPYDRVGAHSEPVPGCNNRLGTDVYRAWATSLWGFAFLGSCAIRTVGGGGNWSVHAVKRANDFGYPSSNRALADDYLTYLTENGAARALILGVQALHDYAIGSDGSYGANRPQKRLWGHGLNQWRFGNIGQGWFWTHTELLVAVARSAPEMNRRLDLLAAYDANTPPEINMDDYLIRLNGTENVYRIRYNTPMPLSPAMLGRALSAGIPNFNGTKTDPRLKPAPHHAATEQWLKIHCGPLTKT